MQPRRLERWTLYPATGLGCAALVAALVAARAADAAPHVRVHLGSTLDIHATPVDDGVRFEGTLSDEAGQPLAGQIVSALLKNDRDPLRVAPCRDAESALTIDRERAGTAALVTDASGRLCALASGSSLETVTGVFEWPGKDLVDGSRTEVKAYPARVHVELRTVGSPVAMLGESAFTLDVAARIVGTGPDAPARGLPLVLTNEKGTELGRTETNALGRGRFDIAPASRLGPPGRGELRASFIGNGTTGPAERVFDIERRTTVRLSASPPAAADPDEGVTIPLVIATETGDAVLAGMVEASVGGRVVGAAAVDRGRADLVATFAADRPTADVTVRFASDAPWYAPGPELNVRVTVRHGTLWRRALLLAASLAVVSWLVLGRARGGPKASLPAVARRVSRGRAGVEVVRAAADPKLGWTGRVVDAHDGAGVEGADVRIERASFEGVEILGRTRTNDAGRFELRCDAARLGDKLVVAAPLHATLAHKATSFGEIQISLCLRRRALLDRLVSWARRHKAAAGEGLEPSPGQVARASRKDSRTRSWAEAVERAAFGPDVVDASLEDDIEKLAPPSARR